MPKRWLTCLLTAVVGLGAALVPTQDARAVAPTVYNTPGDHYTNGRWWHTECSQYSSQIVRCTSKIWGTKAVLHGGRYYRHDGWVFNNTTYLPATRAAWGSNPMVSNTGWTDGSGRQWESKCVPSECRVSTYNKVGSFTGSGYTTSQQWVLNSIIQFSSATTAPVTTVPAAAPRKSGVPVEKPFVPPMKPTLYTQPGDHYVNGRYWRTTCQMYAPSIVRCRTEIFGTKIVTVGGRYVAKNGWSFNNQAYLPAPKSAWGSNKLANAGAWTQNGRQWKTECNNSTTGRNACRSSILATAVEARSGRFVVVNKWVLNNIVMFSHSRLAPQKTIPAASARIASMPVEQTLPAAVTFRTDSRCNSGRVLCISKNQRKMAWMVNGRIIKIVDVRFGSELTPTRNGVFSVYWKSRDHVSSLYGSAMPFAIFFSGGQAVHYSRDFARNGYSGASHGCVNVRDYNGIKWLFDTQVRTHDKVVVYY